MYLKQIYGKNIFWGNSRKTDTNIFQNPKEFQVIRNILVEIVAFVNRDLTLLIYIQNVNVKIFDIIFKCRFLEW